MIIFLVTAAHGSTVQALLHHEIAVDLLSYERLRQLTMLPRATYVFTDLDRLPTETLSYAAIIYQQLRRNRFAVLNDPARVLSRYGLLRRLFLSGFNQFNAYRVEDGTRPTRWPVFLRTEGDHNPPFPELFETSEALERGIGDAVDRGVPFSRLLIVEFAAQPVRPGHYRKFSCFRIGRASFAHTCVNDNQWIAKVGRRDITPPELYDEELRIVRENPYGPAVAAAFDVAAIEYGRADFGLVDGKIQLYEINSNPFMKFEDDHPSAVRQQAYKQFEQNYFEALRAIDTPNDSGDPLMLAAKHERRSAKQLAGKIINGVLRPFNLEVRRR